MVFLRLHVIGILYGPFRPVWPYLALYDLMAPILGWSLIPLRRWKLAFTVPISTYVICAMFEYFVVDINIYSTEI